MHPAYSVILFTTASGAGYGLLVWLAVFGELGLAPITLEFGLAGFVLALGLVSIGLLVLDLPSRPSRARVARGDAMAHRPGCRAKASRRLPLTCRPAFSRSAGCSSDA